MSWKKTLQTLALSLLVLMGLPAAAGATCLPTAQSCSSTYSVSETYFGSGGNLNSCGTTYCSKQSAGGTAVGNTAGTTYKAQAGIDTAEPYIHLLVPGTNADCGVVNATTTGTCTAGFSVKTYLASGYNVQTVGQPPKYGSHTMTAISSPSNSAAGTEQFGINLAANNSCSGVANGSGGTITGSADPVQNPTGFGFGAAAHNSGTDYYDTACKFMYADGDTIASSSTSSGETDYTISYVLNIQPLTPAGTYVMNQVIVATSTFEGQSSG